MIDKYTDSKGNLIWIDLFNPSQDEIETIASEQNLKVDQILNITKVSSRHLEYCHNVFYFCLPHIVPLNADIEPTDVQFILTSKILVTIHKVKLPSFEETKKHLNEINRSYEVFIFIIEKIAYLGGNLLEELNAKTTILSKDVFQCTERYKNIGPLNKHLRHTLFDLGVYGNKVSQIREIQLGLHRILSFIIDKKPEMISAEYMVDLHSVKKDIDSLTEFEMHLTSRIQFILDAVLGFINTEQNDIFKVLTIVTVVGIPPTLIASWYGMNFHFIPEYVWIHGYLYVIIITIISIILPILWFKIKGWW